MAEGDVLAEPFHRDGLDSGEAVELVAGAVRVGPRENFRVPREPEPVSEADVHTDGTGMVHV